MESLGGHRSFVVRRPAPIVEAAGGKARFPFGAQPHREWEGSFEAPLLCSISLRVTMYIHYICIYVYTYFELRIYCYFRGPPLLM